MHESHYYNHDALVLSCPLIDNNQTFDIAVSVWVKATEEHEEAHRKQKVVDENTAESTQGE